LTKVKNGNQAFYSVPARKSRLAFGNQMQSVRLILPFVILAFLSGESAFAQRVETGFLNRTVTVSGLTLRYQVYVPVNYTPSQNWPVILYLHGAGERGTDGIRQTLIGLGSAVRNDARRFPALIIYPQAPPDSSWTGMVADGAIAALDAVQREYRTDPDRVYLTGLSMGGNGAWYIAYRHPERFAAIAPICGWVTSIPLFRGHPPVVPGNTAAFKSLAEKLRGVPTWIFHGEVDAVVPVSESRQAHDALRAVNTNVRYSELPGIAHNAWDPAYASVEFTNWLFAQRRRGRAIQ
jgi:predicted peptidase